MWKKQGKVCVALPSDLQNPTIFHGVDLWPNNTLVVQCPLSPYLCEEKKSRSCTISLRITPPFFSAAWSAGKCFRMEKPSFNFPDLSKSLFFLVGIRSPDRRPSKQCGGWWFVLSLLAQFLPGCFFPRQKLYCFFFLEKSFLATHNLLWEGEKRKFIGKSRIWYKTLQTHMFFFWWNYIWSVSLKIYSDLPKALSRRFRRFIKPVRKQGLWKIMANPFGTRNFIQNHNSNFEDFGRFWNAPVWERFELEKLPTSFSQKLIFFFSKIENICQCWLFCKFHRQVSFFGPKVHSCQNISGGLVTLTFEGGGWTLFFKFCHHLTLNKSNFFSFDPNLKPRKLVVKWVKKFDPADFWDPRPENRPEISVRPKK